MEQNPRQYFVERISIGQASKQDLRSSLFFCKANARFLMIRHMKKVLFRFLEITRRTLNNFCICCITHKVHACTTSRLVGMVHMRKHLNTRAIDKAIAEIVQISGLIGLPKCRLHQRRLNYRFIARRLSLIDC